MNAHSVAKDKILRKRRSCGWQRRFSDTYPHPGASKDTRRDASLFPAMWSIAYVAPKQQQAGYQLLCSLQPHIQRRTSRVQPICTYACADPETNTSQLLRAPTPRQMEFTGLSPSSSVHPKALHQRHTSPPAAHHLFWTKLGQTLLVRVLSLSTYPSCKVVPTL